MGVDKNARQMNDDGDDAKKVKKEEPKSTSGDAAKSGTDSDQMMGDALKGATPKPSKKSEEEDDEESKKGEAQSTSGDAAHGGDAAAQMADLLNEKSDINAEKMIGDAFAGGGGGGPPGAGGGGGGDDSEGKEAGKDAAKDAVKEAGTKAAVAAIDAETGGLGTALEPVIEEVVGQQVDQMSEKMEGMTGDGGEKPDGDSAQSGGTAAEQSAEIVASASDEKDDTPEMSDTNTKNPAEESAHSSAVGNYAAEPEKSSAPTPKPTPENDADEEKSNQGPGMG